MKIRQLFGWASTFILTLFLLSLGSLRAQKDPAGRPLFINVNKINLEMKKLNGEGQFTNQYSWMLTGSNPQNTETWYYPSDQWHSQMLYQIYNPVALDDNGIIDEDTTHYIIPPEDNHAFRSVGKNVYSWERRRYRPPYVTVDGIAQSQKYGLKTYPNQPADIIATWEDVLVNFGMRVRVDVYGFSNPNHADYLIWKATYKFTGESKIPLEDPQPYDFFPDQSIRLWWPLAFSFGPTKRGEYAVLSSFALEGEDDLDSWFSRASQLDGARDTLKIGYYWDYKYSGTTAYPNGSTDDQGDPDRQTGHLYSPQIPGIALLFAAKNSFDKTKDDLSQPYAIPHANILNDFWNNRSAGRRDIYIGNNNRGRFPKDPITDSFLNFSKGPMRFITIGPYELTKNAAQSKYDSICAVYAVGVGSISWEKADSVGKAWFNGSITDQEKDDYMMTGVDSLFQVMDRANWAWKHDFKVPAPPPPPDIKVESGPDRIVVDWSYPNAGYFTDPLTGENDWAAWRVYRKRGAAYVDDPGEQATPNRWELIYKTTDRNNTEYVDTAVTRGVSYYYAVTSLDDGSSNTNGIFPGQALESSRFVNRSALPAISFKGGLATTKRVRVVPNPATVAAGALGFPGDADRLLFANLPFKCKLTVFTETGDRIVTIDHAGTDQEIWNQRNDANQYVTSGIYILAVTQAESADSKSLPDQFEKFVLVR